MANVEGQPAEPVLALDGCMYTAMLKQTPTNVLALSDPEQTALDMVAHPRLFGTLGTALETLEAHLERLDMERLAEYALRYDVGATIKRLGWALEALGTPATVVEPLRSCPHLLPPGSDRATRRGTGHSVAGAGQPAEGSR